MALSHKRKVTMKTLTILSILLTLSVTGIAKAAGTTITFPEPVIFTNSIPSIEIQPISVDESTGTYTVTAIHSRKRQLATTNGVAVAYQAKMHVAIVVTAVEQVAWLQSRGITDITLAIYAETPISPKIKIQMITAIALSKALPVINAILRD